MNLKENTILAWEGLKSNKVRSILTMLGIIIGISSVIAIVTVGNSMTGSISTSMQSFGTTNIFVNIQKRDVDTDMSMDSSLQIDEDDRITDEMIEKYISIYGDKIDTVSLSETGDAGKAKDGRLYANVTITGTNEGYKLASNITMLKGRYINEGDVKSNRNVAVVSDKFVSNMFSTGVSPLGQEIKVSTDESIQTFTVVGVYKHESMGMMGGASATGKDVRTDLYIPISSCKKLMASDDGYTWITVMGRADTDLDSLTEDTTKFFNIYYKNNTRYEIDSTSMESIMSTMSEIMGTLQIAIAVIAGISLLVGGVGVMNIMLVSVTERTREIGTRKALGARSTAIQTQFIVESVIICAFGGAIGVVIGVLLGYVGSMLMGSPGFPSIGIIVIAVLFSMMIGVFFGYYPATKAAKLDPIEALRYE